MCDGLKLKFSEILVENSSEILLRTRNQAVEQRPPEAYKDMHKSFAKLLLKCLISPNCQTQNETLGSQNHTDHHL